MAKHNELGKMGEAMATAMLVGKGLRIRNHNWRCGKLEIDIVAESDDEIIFVEVKTRQNAYFADPKDAVTPKKIRNIVRAADAYIKEYEVDKPARFDIVEIVGDDGGAEIDHIEGAFLPPLM